MGKLAEFLQDSKHEFSATRLGFLLWVIGTLVVWMVGSINSAIVATSKGMNMIVFPEVPVSVATIIGVLMTGKVVQKFGENSSGSNTPSGTTQPDAPETPASKG